MSISNKDIDQIVSLLSKQVANLEGVYLFGSCLTEFFTTASDIDIAVKATNRIEIQTLWELRNMLANTLKREIDLVDLSVADTVLRMQVISTGSRVFTSNFKKSEAWDSLVFSMYLQLNDDRREILKEIVSSGRVYG